MKKIESFFNEVLSGEDMEHDEDWVIRLGFLVHDAARLRRIAIDDKFKPLEERTRSLSRPTEDFNTLLDAPFSSSRLRQEVIFLN